MNRHLQLQWQQTRLLRNCIYTIYWNEHDSNMITPTSEQVERCNSTQLFIHLENILWA